ADAAFLPKARFGPGVDVMMRIEGPLARQQQHLFASDWMAHAPDDMAQLLLRPPPPCGPGFTGQVVAGGPISRSTPMPEVFTTLMFSARRSLTITTPYYIPDEPLQAALIACAHRGVETVLTVPAVNDSWFVRVASRASYESLLAAGVRIFEYNGGLLHAKTLTLDDEIALVGSANLDRRSLALNFENNVLLHDPEVAAELRRLQDGWIARSTEVHAEDVAAWSWRIRLRNNVVALLGPIL
ncbi:phospholipase D-like domain-containing protein, partial [uncultured Albimonas sp.]|uniref:phospholipase D-like domain-containing protein n=1 Tax=uncultured Albimonas sp. TaxID=1331701 RepID=UPI0030EBB85B